MLSVISLVVAVFGLIGLLFSLRQSYRARLREFEERYVERYWSILDDLSLEALSLSHANPGESDERAIRKYILLCEDELQMRKNGYISDSTYEEWADGMLDQLAQPMFKAIWEQIEQERTSQKYASPYANLTALLKAQNYKSGESGDPLSLDPSPASACTPVTCGNARSGSHLIGARLSGMFPQVRGSTWQAPAPGMNN